MDERENNIVEDVEITKKEQLEEKLEKVKTIADATASYTEMQKALENKEIEEEYARYFINTLEDKIFYDAKFDKISPKVLLEVICPRLKDIENFQLEKLAIEEIGSHLEEQENYLDKICTYEHKFICLFGVNEKKPEEVQVYEERKFIRQDMIEAVRMQYEEGKKIDMRQYDEYYVGIEEDRLKVYTERKIVALMKIEETPFDKIKSKLASLLNKNPFVKKKYLPHLNLVYDTNPNRLAEWKHKSKVEAKSRMKALLNKEREITRNTAV